MVGKRQIGLFLGRANVFLGVASDLCELGHGDGCRALTVVSARWSGSPEWFLRPRSLGTAEGYGLLIWARSSSMPKEFWDENRQATLLLVAAATSVVAEGCPPAIGRQRFTVSPWPALSQWDVVSDLGARSGRSAVDPAGLRGRAPKGALPLSYQGSIVISSPVTVIRTVRRNPRLMSRLLSFCWMPLCPDRQRGLLVLSLHLDVPSTASQWGHPYQTSGGS